MQEIFSRFFNWTHIMSWLKVFRFFMLFILGKVENIIVTGLIVQEEEKHLDSKGSLSSPRAVVCRVSTGHRCRLFTTHGLYLLTKIHSGPKIPPLSSVACRDFKLFLRFPVDFYRHLPTPTQSAFQHDIPHHHRSTAFGLFISQRFLVYSNAMVIYYRPNIQAHHFRLTFRPGIEIEAYILLPSPPPPPPPILIASHASLTCRLHFWSIFEKWSKMLCRII